MSYYSLIRPHGKRKKSGKKMAEIYHSREKALLRYNIELTSDLRAQIISAIRNRKADKAIFIQRRSNRVSLWRVKIGDYPRMIVVYDKHRKEIVTVLNDKDKKGEGTELNKEPKELLVD